MLNCRFSLSVVEQHKKLGNFVFRTPMLETLLLVTFFSGMIEIERLEM